jgi:hypothetical protein
MCWLSFAASPEFPWMFTWEILPLEDLRDPTDPSYKDAGGDASRIAIGPSPWATILLGLLKVSVWQSMDSEMGKGMCMVGRTLRLTVFVVTNCLFGLLFTIPITLNLLYAFKSNESAISLAQTKPLMHFHAFLSRHIPFYLVLSLLPLMHPIKL